MRIGFVACLAALACTSSSAFDIQGHRGARGLAPENTLAAFKRAIDIGVTTIETDVGVTRDLVLVVAHDRRLNPALTRDGRGRWITEPAPAVNALTLAEVKAFDVGRIDPSSPYAKQWPQQKPVDGERMPQLSELIALVREKKGPVYAPKSIEVLDALPLTPVGKADKKVLRARYWAGHARRVN